MDSEAEDILAEYNAIRKVYNALDRDDPLEAAQRADLKERYYELDRMYAEIVRKGRGPSLDAAAKIAASNSSVSPPLPKPSPVDAVSSRAKGDVMWGGVMEELEAKQKGEDSANLEWVDTHTPVESEEAEYFAELDSLTKSHKDQMAGSALPESAENLENVPPDIEEDGDASNAEGLPAPIATSLPQLSDADLDTDDQSAEEEETADPIEKTISPHQAPDPDVDAKERAQNEPSDSQSAKEEPADAIVTGIRPIECPSCGERLPAGSTNCPACKTRLTPAESESEASQSRREVKSQRAAGPDKGIRTTKLLTVIGCFFVVIGGAIAASFASGVGEEEITKALESAGVNSESVTQYGFVASAIVALLGGTFLGIGAFMFRFIRVVIPIHDLARTGRLDALKRAIAMGEDVNQMDSRNCTPLHFAVVAGQREAISVLLDNGADIELRNDRGETALHLACANRDTELVRHLLEQGANLRTRNASGSTVMHVAAWVGDLELMKMFRQQELEIEARNNAELTPLHYAAQSGHEEAVEYLLREGADADTSAESGATPLCSAARNGHLVAVKLLLEAGANPNVKEGYSYISPLQVAIENSRKKVAAYLKKHGAVE